MRKGRKRLWRHWKRAVRGDEARRQGQLTRLMSSPSPTTLRCPIHFLSLSLSLRASYSPSFLTNHPPFNPPAITLHPSCIPLLSLATFEVLNFSTVQFRCSFYFSSPLLIPRHSKFNYYARIANLLNVDEFVMPCAFIRSE